MGEWLWVLSAGIDAGAVTLGLVGVVVGVGAVLDLWQSRPWR